VGFLVKWSVRVKADKAGNMQILCHHCGSKARISSSKEITDRIRHIYVQCSNVHCSHSFLCSLNFEKTISPPADGARQLVFDLVQGMSDQHKRELRERLG